MGQRHLLIKHFKIMTPVDQTGAEVFRPQNHPLVSYFFGKRGNAFIARIFPAK